MNYLFLNIIYNFLPYFDYKTSKYFKIFQNIKYIKIIMNIMQK